MSGPVSNSLAQLEDALLEAGLDRSFLVDLLVERLTALDEALRSTLILAKTRPEMQVLRQRTWDHLAVLWPTWRAVTIGADHEIALREHRSPAASFARWMRRGAAGPQALSAEQVNQLYPGLMVVDEVSGLHRMAVALGRASGKTAFIDSFVREEVSVHLVNWAGPLVPKSRVPEFLQHKPGRQRRR